MSLFRTVLFASALSALCLPASGQIDKGMQKYFDMLDRCPRLMAGKKYDEALPLMQQIIKALEPKMSINRTYERAVEFCYLNSALAYLETERYAVALDWFDRFLRKFPRSVNRRAVIMLMADTHAALQQWDDVLRIVNPLVGKRGLSYREEVAVHELRSEAYFTKKNFQEAATSALHLVQRAQEFSVRNNAIIMLSTCLVRLKRYEELYKFIPLVYQTPARFDVGLNLALIEEGDKEFGSQHYQNALLLYRLVFSSEVLAHQLGVRIGELEAIRKSPKAIAQLTAARNTSSIKRRIARLIKAYEKQRLKLSKQGNYDPGLNMRVATCYFALDRFLESLHAFYGVYEDFPDHELAQRALYSTFTTAHAMHDEPRAIKEAYRYMRAYPKGEYWEQLTVNLAQIHSQKQEFDESNAIARKALEMKPDHSNADQLVYVIGYNHFYANDIESAGRQFDLLRKNHPQSSFLEAGDYWRAMCDLFAGRYGPATGKFETYLKKYLGGPYYVDATYRLALSQYGANDFDRCMDTLEGFLERFPNHPMGPDAANMLGDIYGSRSLLDKAVATYRRTMKNAEDMIQINYALFRIAKTFRLEHRYEEIITLFEEYTEQYGEEGNFTEAAYWTGTAYDRMGKREKALEIFFDTVVLYGDVPKHHGVDMILRDIIREKDAWGSQDDKIAFLKRLYAAMEEAREDKKTTLHLRLTAMFAEVAKEPDSRTRLLATMMQDRYIPHAGPITLEVLGKEAMRTGDLRLARLAFTRFLDHHRESDLALAALRGLAELHIRDKDFGKASGLLEEIISRYAEFEDAGWATLRLADLHRLAKRFDEAEAGYNQVLAVKEWRGPIWAEALYLRGMVELDRGRIRKAFAYFQRIYVMYDSHAEWAAKSYLRSADCLERLNLKVDAIKTLEELIAHPGMKGRPEVVSAQGRLRELRGG